MFCVVETQEESGLQCVAVPKSWIVDDNTLLWPILPTDLKGRKMGIPPKNDWKSINCRILYRDLSKIKQYFYHINIAFLKNLMVIKKYKY